MPFAAALMPPRTFVLLPEAIGDVVFELATLMFQVFDFLSVCKERFTVDKVRGKVVKSS